MEVKQRINRHAVGSRGRRGPPALVQYWWRRTSVPPALMELLDRLRQLFTGSLLRMQVQRLTLIGIERSRAAKTCASRDLLTLDVVPGTEVQLIFARFCRTQEESKEVRTKSYQIEFARPTPSGHTPVRGDFRPREQQQRMRFPASESPERDGRHRVCNAVRAVPQACSHSAARLESLLNYLADYQPRASAKPRARSASAWQHRTPDRRRHSKPPSNPV